MASKIFINYRRDDARADARSIHDRLASAYGANNVFMDVDRLSAGQRFDLELDKALKQCDVFLCVIGSRWLSMLHARHESGERDYVREEVASALARGIIVIPVLIDNVLLPRADALPQDIRPLVLHQKHDVTHGRFGRDIEDLKAAIKAARRRDRGSLRLTGWRWLVPVALSVTGVAAAGLSLYMLSPAAPDKSKGGRKAEVTEGESAKPKAPDKRESASAIGTCSDSVSIACLRNGSIPGFVATNLSQLSCVEEKTISSAELQWKSIWTTSVYSYAPGGGGPGGGLENDILRVGGWGDWYYALMRFELPKLPRPTRFAAIFLFAKQDDGAPVAMQLDRITQSWGWRPGDRLWWKDKPAAVVLASIPPPMVGNWYAIDITSAFEDWRSGRSENHGIQLRPTANDKNFNAFHSGISDDRAKRPRLLVCT